jgi:hypothetical protein
VKSAKSHQNDDLAAARIMTAISRPDAPQRVCKACNGPFCAISAAIRSFWPADLTALANEAPPAHDYEFIGLSNEIAAVDGEGWARIPYGDHPHEKGLQRFSKADAEEMVSYFKNTWNRLKRVVSGLPILRGHPDHAEFANQHKDKTSYGTVADMEARDDAFYLKPVVTPAGEALIASGLKYFSPHWLARKVGLANGKPIFAPVFLVSIGLTDRPNIGGTSLVNSKPTMNNAHLIALLAAIGRNVAADATDEQIDAEIVAATPLANSLLQRPEPTALANEQTKVTTLTTEVAGLKTQLTDAGTALANEKAAHQATIKARNVALVDGAVRAGRITEASKPVWLGRLERDFATESVALANEQGAIKTHARTGNLGDRKEPTEASAQFTALVNEAMPKHGNSWDRAWAAVKATKEGKALLAKMDAANTAADA